MVSDVQIIMYIEIWYLMTVFGGGGRVGGRSDRLDNVPQFAIIYTRLRDRPETKNRPRPSRYFKRKEIMPKTVKTNDIEPLVEAVRKAQNTDVQTGKSPKNLDAMWPPSGTCFALTLTGLPSSSTKAQRVTTFQRVHSNC